MTGGSGAGGAGPHDVAAYYDEFAPHQARKGVNLRHRTIARDLARTGLRPGLTILEVGCGIGAVTGLVAPRVAPGKVVAVDVSPASIATARTRLRAHTNVELVVSDMSDFTRPERFDRIVLPDVIEHIPIEAHPALFETLRRHIGDDGRMLVNVPCPQALDHLRETRPETLQVIDQSIPAHELIARAAAAGFYLDSFRTYGLQYEGAEYHSLVLRPAYRVTRLEPVPRWKIRARSLWLRLRPR